MKKIKKWIPLLCTTLLLLCSSINCYAYNNTYYTNYGYQELADMDFDIDYLNELAHKHNSDSILPDSIKLNHLFIDNTDSQYVLYLSYTSFVYDKSADKLSNNGGACVSFNYYPATETGRECLTIPDNSLRTGCNVVVGSSKVKFNENVYDSSGKIFFRQPSPIAKQAIVLSKTVQNQTMMILPIAVCCLALVIGSLVLLPRLRMFLKA